jgi:hypothetical protein
LCAHHTTLIDWPSKFTATFLAEGRELPAK